MFTGPFTIFKKLTDTIHYNESMKSQLEDEHLQNLEELEKAFNGSVKIVVTEAAEGAGPFTIPAISDILTTNKLLNVVEGREGKLGLESTFNQIRFTFQRFYDFFKEGVTITKSGDSFEVNTSFNNPVIVYVPKWFLEDKPTLAGLKGRIAEIDITDDSRIGIILHEIGHWTNNSMLFASLAFIIRILGLLLFIFSMFKIVANSANPSNSINQPNNLFQKVKSFGSTKLNSLKSNVVDPLKVNLFYAITGIIGFIVYRMAFVSNVFSTFNETNADNIAKKFGYGQEVSDYVVSIMTKLGGESYSGPLSNFQNFIVLFKELFTRLTSSYPSLEWRSGNLLGMLESDENIELFLENEILESSKLSNILTSMLSKFDKLVKDLPSLNSGSIRSVSNKNNRIINTKINENIDLLINECK